MYVQKYRRRKPYPNTLISPSTNGVRRCSNCPHARQLTGYNRIKLWPSLSTQSNRGYENMVHIVTRIAKKETHHAPPKSPHESQKEKNTKQSGGGGIKQARAFLPLPLLLKPLRHKEDLKRRQPNNLVTIPDIEQIMYR